MVIKMFVGLLLGVGKFSLHIEVTTEVYKRKFTSGSLQRKFTNRRCLHCELYTTSPADHAPFYIIHVFKTLTPSIPSQTSSFGPFNSSFCQAIIAPFLSPSVSIILASRTNHQRTASGTMPFNIPRK